jgi:5-(carboxyamino)imidazole ribonucleotide mutase
MPQVGVIVGSKGDISEDVLEALRILRSCVIAEISIISAHRNPEALRIYCRDALERGIDIFIAAAGMSAALPGDIAAEIKFSKPVIGVALPSKEFPSAEDAFHSIARMPGGCPVIFAGIGKAGLKNAALIALQCLALANQEIAQKLQKIISANTNPARVGLNQEELEKIVEENKK